MTKARRRALAVVAVIAGLAVAGWLDARLGADEAVKWVPVIREDLAIEVEVSGALKAVHSDEIGPPIIPDWWDYKITFLAPEGKNVKQGDPVLGFDTVGLQDLLREKEAERDETRTTLEKRQAELELEAAREKLALAEAEALLRKAEIRAAIPPELAKAKEAREAQLDLDLGKKKVEESRNRLEAVARAQDEELSVLRSRLRRAESRVAELMTSIGQMEVKAPRPGTVVYVADWRGEKSKVGDSTWWGEKILEIPDLDAMRAEGEVDEVDSGRIEAGQTVRFRLDAHPDFELTGRVADVRRSVRTRSMQDRTKIARIEITLERTDRERMRPGMRFRGTIEIGRLPQVLQVPVEAVQTRADGTFVRRRGWWRIREVAVELGKTNGKLAQVIGGLADGDRVEVRGTKPEKGT